MTARTCVLLVYTAMLLGSSFVPMPASSSPQAAHGLLHPSVQNLLHIPAFGILWGLLISLMRDKGGTISGQVLLAAAIAFGVGILMEIIQIPVPGRYASFMDVALNSMGILCGVLIFVCSRFLFQDIRG